MDIQNDIVGMPRKKAAAGLPAEALGALDRFNDVDVLAFQRGKITDDVLRVLACHRCA